jgi:uncharacterized membrane protein
LESGLCERSQRISIAKTTITFPNFNNSIKYWSLVLASKEFTPRIVAAFKLQNEVFFSHVVAAASTTALRCAFHTCSFPHCNPRKAIVFPEEEVDVG